jgi:homoserine kinase
MVFARVPASSANLGPGFDTLAVALELYVEVDIQPSATFQITSEGFGAGQHDNAEHLAAVVASSVLGHRNFTIHINSEIPIKRGLGSSAALALAAAAAAGAADPMAVATSVDGHAENAAASMFGGLVVASYSERDGALARSLPLDEAWRFVVVVPDQELSTHDARAVLPDQVDFNDAVHNLNSLGLLIAGLADHREFVASAMDDYLHQPYRMALLTFAQPLLTRLTDAGALGSCWSGAGSAMLALTTPETVTDVVLAAREFLVREGVEGSVLELKADLTGLVTR